MGNYLEEPQYGGLMDWHFWKPYIIMVAIAIAISLLF
jgi:hypothetical protein